MKGYQSSWWSYTKGFRSRFGDRNKASVGRSENAIASPNPAAPIDSSRLTRGVSETAFREAADDDHFPRLQLEALNLNGGPYLIGL